MFYLMRLVFVVHDVGIIEINPTFIHDYFFFWKIKFFHISVKQDKAGACFWNLWMWLSNKEKKHCTTLPLLGLFLSAQLEWLTGGECLAGMHEVVVTKRTLEAIALAKEQNRSLWRVSSTVSYIDSHIVLVWSRTSWQVVGSQILCVCHLIDSPVVCLCKTVVLTHCFRCNS